MAQLHASAAPATPPPCSPLADVVVDVFVGELVPGGRTLNWSAVSQPTPQGALADRRALGGLANPLGQQAILVPGPAQPLNEEAPGVGREPRRFGVRIGNAGRVTSRRHGTRFRSVSEEQKVT
jgi:hypothetical protein